MARPSLNFPLHTYRYMYITHMHAYILCVDTCEQCLHTCVHMYSQRKTHTQVQLTHTYTHTFVRVCYITLVVFSSLRPCGLWPARLLCPWDSTGKNTGVGCHASSRKHAHLCKNRHTSLIKTFIPRWEKSMWLGTKWPNSVKNKIKMRHNPITQMNPPLVYNIHYAALSVPSFMKSFNIHDYMWHCC